MIKIGMMIGERYEILDKIGTGGMSDVYKAKDEKLGRPVAVKVLKQEFSENANFVSKFRTEAQAAAGMMHPNIVNVYDVGEEGGIHYIVMELVEGITLKKYIEKKSRLSVKEAVSIAIQVCMGLEAAHNNHIIHRDIKPQNIMISKDGKVKVTDFGIAKAVSSNTITSNVMGSVHYTSPEQARGGYSDEKSDIYSLGISLFEMLTGRVPFNGETTVAIAIKHIQEPMPSPRIYVSEIPISVEQIVLKATQKSPDRRYHNMQELVDDLKRSLMTPDEDFVKLNGLDEEAATRAISDEEIKNVTERVRQREEYDEKYAVRVNKNPEKKVRQSDARPAKPQGTKAGNAPRRPERQEEKSATSRKQKPNKKAKAALSDDNADKVMTIIAIVAAVIVGILIIIFIGQAIGVFDLGKKAEVSEETQENAASSELAADEVMVPSVIDKSYAEAVATLNREGFTVEKVEVPSDKVAKGNVVNQLPAAGEVVKRGGSITVSVSTGANASKVQVPSLIGLDPMEATALLVEAGLTPGTIEETTNADISLLDKICYQSYVATSSVDAGTVIDMKVSIGVGTVTYSYVGNVESPYLEDNAYQSGSTCTIIVSTLSGVELKRETTSTFPVSMNISGIPDSEMGTVTIIYNVNIPGQTTTNEAGETVEIPEVSEERTIVRTVTFTRE